MICRVDDLYNFLLLWVPHLYGELEEMDPKSRGYELVESDTELWEDESGESGPGGKDERRASDELELTELTRESWEVSNATVIILHFAGFEGLCGNSVSIYSQRTVFTLIEFV